MKKLLDCSNKGDIRFSPDYAKVECFGVEDTIMNHYINAKIDDSKMVLRINYKDMKKEFKYNVKYIDVFYKMLWFKYLEKHPIYIEYAAKFDDYIDSEVPTSIHVDIIRQYIKKGRDSILSDIQELNKLIKNDRMIVQKEYEQFELEHQRINETITKKKTQNEYKAMNKKVYKGCVGQYGWLPVTQDQIKVIADLVEKYKIRVHCVETRKDATDTIHKIFTKIHNGEVKIRMKHNGHVEIINEEYVYVEN